METAEIIAILDKKPDSLALEVTTRCPLDCNYCKRKRLGIPIDDVSLEKLAMLKERIGNFKRVQFCGFGEPFSHRDFYGVLHLFKELQPIIVTNGALPIQTEKLRQSVRSAVVSFSLDAPDLEGARRVSPNYNWQNVLANLEALALEKSFPVTNNLVVNEYNMTRMGEMIEFCKAKGVKVVSVSLWIGDNGEEHSFVLENKSRIKIAVKEALKKAREVKLMALSPFGELKCSMFGTIVPYVDLLGNVHTCCVTKGRGENIGNIYEQDFDTIWESEAYKHFRSGEVCKACALYSWAREN